MNARERGGIIVKVLLFVCLAVFCFILYLGRNPILRVAGRYWTIEDPLVKSDALVILSDDNFTGDRATRAAELFRAGGAPRIVASGRRLRPYAGIAELIERDLVERGVPKEAILRFPQDGDNTLEEAQQLVPLAIKQKWRRLIVVTSNYHTRRARYIYRRIFPASIGIRVTGARDAAYDPENWWYSRKGMKLFFTETVGIVVAAWQLRHAAESSMISLGIRLNGCLGGSTSPQYLVYLLRVSTITATVISSLQVASAILSSGSHSFSSVLSEGTQLRGFGVCI